MNLIEGIKIDVSSEELKRVLEERRDYHAAKEKFYGEQVAALQAQGVSTQSASNDPVTSLKSSQKGHQDKKAFFAYVAEHVIPGATYRLTDHDLARLEVLASYY